MFGYLILIGVFSFLLWIALRVVIELAAEKDYSKDLVAAVFAILLSLSFWIFIYDSNVRKQEDEENLRKELDEKHAVRLEEELEKVKSKAIDETIYRLGEKLRDDCFELVYQKRKPTATEKKLCEESIFSVPEIKREVLALD